jgi:hypothetical protein
MGISFDTHFFIVFYCHSQFLWSAIFGLFIFLNMMILPAVRHGLEL